MNMLRGAAHRFPRGGVDSVQLQDDTRANLWRLGLTLVDQKSARVIVEAKKRAEGFWFGGGKLTASEGRLYLTGRYRNPGDARTGIAAGSRGLELAIFNSDDRGRTFQKLLSWSKADLASRGGEVLSIEGSCLWRREDHVELLVSIEKAASYPAEFAAYQKPGTGVWSIDRLCAPSIEELAHASVQPLLQGGDPQFLHVKDPLLYQTTTGETLIYFSTHPFSWASSNSGCVRVDSDGSIGSPRYDFFPRGSAWDVAISRVTGVVPLPPIRVLAGQPALSLVFYDGGESMRRYGEHPRAVHRARGSSCEEVGGLAVMVDDDPTCIQRLSVNTPAFISPYGTGSSRYVDVLVQPEGWYVTWQQSQEDLSQPLVMNFVEHARVEETLGSHGLPDASSPPRR